MNYVLRYVVYGDTYGFGIGNGYKSLVFKISNLELLAWYMIPEENIGNKRISLRKLYRLHYHSRACGLCYSESNIFRSRGLEEQIKGEFEVTKKELIDFLEFLRNKEIVTDINFEDVYKIIS